MAVMSDEKKNMTGQRRECCRNWGRASSACRFAAFFDVSLSGLCRFVAAARIDALGRG